MLFLIWGKTVKICLGEHPMIILDETLLEQLLWIFEWNIRVCVTHEQNHNYERFIKVGTWAVSSSSSARAVLNLILNKLSAVAENTVI